MKYGWIFLIFIACQSGPREWVPEKDMANFTLPQDIVQMAPHMQADLMRLIRYPSPAFRIKPKFVFIDGEQLVEGPMDPLVPGLDLLHLDLKKDGKSYWHGSVLFDWNQGTGLTTKTGWVIDLKPVEGGLEVVLEEGGFSWFFPSGQDRARTEKRNGYELFAYVYQFPRKT